MWKEWGQAPGGGGTSAEMSLLSRQLAASIDFLRLTKMAQAAVLTHSFCFAMWWWVVAPTHGGSTQQSSVRSANTLPWWKKGEVVWFLWVSVECMFTVAAPCPNGIHCPNNKHGVEAALGVEERKHDFGKNWNRSEWGLGALVGQHKPRQSIIMSSYL